MRPRAFGPSGCQRARIACAPMEWSTDSRGVYNVVHSGRRDAPLPEIAQLAAIILDERLPRDGANGCHKRCKRLRLKLNTYSKTTSPKNATLRIVVMMLSRMQVITIKATIHTWAITRSLSLGVESYSFPSWASCNYMVSLRSTSMYTDKHSTRLYMCVMRLNN